MDVHSLDREYGPGPRATHVLGRLPGPRFVESSAACDLVTARRLLAAGLHTSVRMNPAMTFER